MSHKTDSGPVDRTRINMNDPFEVRYWSKELEISGSQLKVVANKVGEDVNAIRHELATTKNKAWQL